MSRSPLLLLVLASCSAPTPTPTPTPGPAPAPAPTPALSWGPSLSIYDILERDPDALAAIAVQQRAADTTSPARTGDYEVWTACVGSACLDGVREVASLEPLIPARLEPGEREALDTGEPDAPEGWLERGVDIVEITPTTISLRRATAWWNGAAARSNASISCETYSRGARYRMRLADVLDDRRADQLTGAARRFLREQRELDPRGSGLGDIDPDSFTVSADGDVTLCIESAVGASAGTAETIQARRP